jgi:fructose-1-phosphate kinase PfkB-like protein
MTELAHEAGTPILIDSSGPPVFEAMPVQPTILKMNKEEFDHSFGIQATSVDELMVKAQTVRERERLPALVITCGAEGIVALTPQGSYWAAAPPQQAVNAAGAGDGASAALAWRLSQGDNWPEALRWTAATGAAVVLTEGTADCHPADIERLREQTQVYSC